MKIRSFRSIRLYAQKGEDTYVAGFGVEYPALFLRFALRSPLVVGLSGHKQHASSDEQQERQAVGRHASMPLLGAQERFGIPNRSLLLCAGQSGTEQHKPQVSAQLCDAICLY